jgi:hypothetical protein
MLRWLRRRQEGSPAGLRRRRGAHPRPWPASALESAPERRANSDRRPLHDDEACQGHHPDLKNRSEKAYWSALMDGRP